MTPDLGTEGGDGMWGQGRREKQAKQEAMQQHEERAAGQLSPELASHHYSPARGRWSTQVVYRAWEARGGILAPLSLHYRT